MKSIQTKFIALIVGCVLLSSFVIGGAGILYAQKVVDEDSAKIMDLLCTEKGQNINALLSTIEQSVNTLAGYVDNVLQDVPLEKWGDEKTKSFAESVEKVALNAANNTEGALAFYVRFNPDYTNPTSGLFWSKATINDDFESLTPTDLSLYESDDMEHVGWYYVPIQNEKATWLLPYFNKNINTEIISFVVPLFRDNHVLGVVGMDIDFNVLKYKVDDTKVYETGYAFLTDQNANVLYHKEVEQGVAIDSLEVSLISVAQELRSGKNENMLFPYQWRNENKLVAFSSLRNGMRLAITAPLREIDVGKNNLIWQIGLSMVLITILALLLTILLTRRLIRPLKELNIAAQKIAEGDLSITISHQTHDEVGTLAQSFEKTAEHLKKYIGYINSLVYLDTLTGVKNKAAYQEISTNLDNRIKLEHVEFAVIVLDINNLKLVNDSLGHEEGDLLISNTCCLASQVFQNSSIYRIGGDEFVIVLEQEDYCNKEKLLNQFYQAIKDFNQKENCNKISVASGMAVYQLDRDQCFGDVFKRADNLMYQNKAKMKQVEKK